MYSTCGDDRLRGLGVAMGRISHFPIDLRRRVTTLSHYRATVRVCDKPVNINIKN